MGRSAGENLVPFLRNVGHKVKGSDLADQHLEDMMDRTLKSFDQLKDLAEALRKIDTRRDLQRGAVSRRQQHYA
ncbi:MAG TPA: hypothetical protein VKM72_35825 [Thermoanaerobaculia bacterium]|nr:hypothetical protein [Thermoanaerobaculia bacterium]